MKFPQQVILIVQNQDELDALMAHLGQTSSQTVLTVNSTLQTRIPTQIPPDVRARLLVGGNPQAEGTMKEMKARFLTESGLHSAGLMLQIFEDDTWRTIQRRANSSSR